MKAITTTFRSFHDGDGIRTTVFFKGCPLFIALGGHKLRHSATIQEVEFDSEKRVGCGFCIELVTLKNQYRKRKKQRLRILTKCDRRDKCGKSMSKLRASVIA